MINQREYRDNNKISSTVRWVLLLSLIYIIRDVFGIAVPDIIFTIFCGMCFAFGSMRDAFCVLSFSTLLTLPSNEIRLLYLLFTLIRSGKLIRLSKINIPILLLLLLQAVDMLIFSQSSVYDAIYTYVNLATALVIPLVWVEQGLDSKTFELALKTFVFGAILVGFITCFLTIRQYGWAILLSGTNSLGRGLDDLLGGSMITYNNRNTIGCSAAVAIAASMALWANRKQKNLISIISVVLSLFIVILTRSRTAFLSVVLIAVFWLLFISNKRGEKIRTTIILLILGLGFFAMYKYFPDLWNGIIGRFIGQSDITNGRIEINTLCLSKWSETIWGLLFGYGVSSFLPLVNFESPHNMIVDILISWGVVGLILLFSWLLLIVKRSFRSVDKYHRAYAILPAFIFFIGRQAGQYLTVPSMHMRLVFLVLCIGAFSLAEKEYECEKC